MLSPVVAACFLIVLHLTHKDRTMPYTLVATGFCEWNGDIEPYDGSSNFGRMTVETKEELLQTQMAIAEALISLGAVEWDATDTSPGVICMTIGFTVRLFGFSGGGTYSDSHRWQIPHTQHLGSNPWPQFATTLGKSLSNIGFVVTDV